MIEFVSTDFIIRSSREGGLSMDLSLIGILLSLVIIMALALRGWSIMLLAPMAVIHVEIFSNMNILDTLTGPYMKGFVNYAGKFYLIFLAGSIFGKVMEDCGAARSIAIGILKVLGRKSALSVLYAITFVTMVLTYGGVSLFVVIFAIVPIARSLFKEMDIPWHLFIAIYFFSISTLTMSMLPGTPSILNIMPTKYMASSLTSAPLLGIVASVVALSFNVWYVSSQLRKCRANNEGFIAPTFGMAAGIEEKDDSNLPNLYLSLMPPIVLLVMLNILNVDIIWSLIGAAILCVAVFWKRYDNLLTTLNKGAMNTVLPIINTSADVGYGMAVAATSGFKVVADWLLDIGGHPLISLSIATTIVGAITGSASGGLGIALETLSAKYLALGLSPDVVHRIMVIAAGSFDALPHNANIFTVFAITGLTHAIAYRHIFWGHIVANTLALIAIIPLAIWLYE